MHTQVASTTTHAAAERIDAFGGGSLFVLTGVVMLVPGLPGGAWLIGFGAILVAVNVARAASGLAPEWLWVIVGAGALLAGAGQIAGLDLPVLALVLIACGIVVIAGPLARRETAR